MPMFLYMSPAISITTKNCMPCTKYRLGTQRIGEAPVLFLFSLMWRRSGSGKRNGDRRAAGGGQAVFEPALHRGERTVRVAPAHERGRGDVHRLERIPEHEMQMGPRFDRGREIARAVVRHEDVDAA